MIGIFLILLLVFFVIFLEKMYEDDLESHRIPSYTPSITSSPSSNSTQAKAKKTCPFCQGTGKVRYYVGGSALEAALNGYEDFYMGPCSSCDGTGYYYE